MPINIASQLEKELQASGVADASQIAQRVAAAIPAGFTEDDLREAFKSGWNQRNKSPGLKRQARGNLRNSFAITIGDARHLEYKYVPDTRTYHNSIWLRSSYKAGLASR